MSYSLTINNLSNEDLDIEIYYEDCNNTRITHKIITLNSHDIFVINNTDIILNNDDKLGAFVTKYKEGAGFTIYDGLDGIINLNVENSILSVGTRDNTFIKLIRNKYGKK